MVLNRISRFNKDAGPIPDDVFSALRSHPKAANVVLPPLLKAIENNDDFLLLVSRHGDVVEYIASVADGYMGKYPLMIMATIPPDMRGQGSHVGENIRHFAQELAAIPNMRSRVYSVFAPDLVARHFAKQWSSLTGISCYEEPYYTAKITYCTRDTLNQSIRPNSQYDFRPAGPDDIPGVAKLCFEFAAASYPFILEEREATREAKILVGNRQVWVALGADREVACIVAYTRNTAEMATVSKVYTSPASRGQNLAKVLMKVVCNDLLNEQGKDSVVLYVAHDNVPANRVYHGVGFVGLEGEGPVDGVEDWTELGFNRDEVVLGHW